MPLISQENSWQKILEFKTDKDSTYKLIGLRNWVNKAGRSGCDFRELEDEISYLLYEYNKHIDLHKLKYKTHQLSTILTLPFELIKRPADTVSKVFDLFGNKIELSESEINAPGREFAYIVKTNAAFR